MFALSVILRVAHVAFLSCFPAFMIFLNENLLLGLDLVLHCIRFISESSCNFKNI